MFTILKRNFLLVLIFAILIYLSLLFIADSEKTISSLKQFPLDLFLLSLLVIFISIIIKFIRWQIYLNGLNLYISLTDSALVFISGFIMTISPGKSGELIKSFLLKSKHSIPIVKSSPIILAERIVEFLSLLLICIIGSTIINYRFDYLVVLVLLFLMIIYLVYSEKFRSKALKIFTRLPFVQKKIDNFEEFSINLEKLFVFNTFFKALVVSVLAWLIEIYGFHLILTAFKSDINIFWSTFTYTISIIFGAVSMLPGGIGTTEGSLTFLLAKKGFTENIAVASTIIIRFLTLWIPVIMGFISLIIFTIKKGDKK